MVKSRKQEDALLVQRAIKGDEVAFKALYDLYRQKVYWICYRYSFDKEAALDLVQDVFIKLYRSLDQYRGDASFYTWLCRITTNTCIDSLRKTRNRPVFGSLNGENLKEEILALGGTFQPDNPDSDMSHGELRGKIAKAMESLSDVQRETLALYSLKDLSYKEIAEVMGCSEGTVMSRLFYARKSLQEKLGEHLV